MSKDKILIAGHINIETTLKIDHFPYEYVPARYPFGGVNASVSGVGLNIAKALTILGHDVQLLSLIGADIAGTVVNNTLEQINVDPAYVIPQLDATCQSVILYVPSGKRSINTDLKDIQDQTYPVESFEHVLSKSTLAVLCNINFTRPMLAITQKAGIPIATDVHAISAIDDHYNADYMRHATILFQSHENLPDTPETWVKTLWNTYGTPIVVIGLGKDGALLGVRESNFLERIPAVYTRPIVNTIGAGDALFSAFLHSYSHTQDPYLAIKKAVVFASYKIGATGAAAGFIDASTLDNWYQKLSAKS